MSKYTPLLKNERSLITTSTFHCDQVVAEISPHEVASFYQSFLDDLKSYDVPLQELQIQNGLKYGVRAKTVCASCQSIINSTSSSSTKHAQYESYFANDQFQEYCGPNAYGHDIEHSGLVLIPLIIDDGGNLVEKPGTHMGYIQSRGTRFERFDVPSSFYPWFGNGRFENTKRDIFMGFLATAGAGTISLLPDFFGYGVSQAFRGYIIRDSYVTATLPLWVKVGSDLKMSTNCNSALADVAFLHGYSEGGKLPKFVFVLFLNTKIKTKHHDSSSCSLSNFLGYASIAIAHGLQSALGIKILKVMVGGTPFRLVSAMMKGVNMADLGISGYFSVGALLGVSYSSTYPDLANYNTGQDLLDPKYMNKSNPELNFEEWFLEDRITDKKIRNRLKDMGANVNGSLMAEIWNTDFTHFLQEALEANVTDPCSPLYSEYKVGVNDQLCKAIHDNDIRDIAHNADYPIVTCYSPTDELIPFDSNIPEVHFNPEYLTTVISQSSHHKSSLGCNLNAISYIASTDDFGNTLLGNNHNLDGCQSESPSSSPSLQLSPSPSNGIRECPVQNLLNQSLYLLIEKYHDFSGRCWKLEISPDGKLWNSFDNLDEKSCNEEAFTNITSSMSSFHRIRDNMLMIKNETTDHWRGRFIFFESPFVSDTNAEIIRYSNRYKAFAANVYVRDCS